MWGEEHQEAFEQHRTVSKISSSPSAPQDKKQFKLYLSANK
jgi:hypothetical protein